MPEQQPKTQHPLASVGGVVGAIGGWSLSHYCGASIWVPGAAAILLLVLFSKTSFRPKYFVGAIATTAAHVVWFVVGSAIMGIWSATALDIVLLTAGIIWLWLRPGLVAAAALGLLQLGSLAINLYSLSAVPVGSAPHRALTAHCTFRVIALICLVVGYRRLRRERSNPPPLPGAMAS
jgi:hypothetical protein